MMIENTQNQPNINLGSEKISNEKESLPAQVKAQPPAENISKLHDKPKVDSNFDIQRKQISSKLSPIAYGISSFYHVIAGGALSLGLVNSDSSFVKNATRFTKLVNSLIYGDLAIDAWKGGHSFDFISKILEPTLNCFSQLSNYHLLRGLGSASTQLHLVNLPHIKSGLNLWENFIANLQETRRFFVEAWSSPWKDPMVGPNRKLFKGKNDQGHTLALLSHVQAISGMVGLLNGNRRNLIDKIAGTIRNVVGVFVDIDLLFRKDIDERRTGQYFLAHAIFDTAKRFLTKEHSDVVDNMIMPLFNGALYHFGKLTRKQSNGTYVNTVDPVTKKKDLMYSKMNESVLAA
jgi:hypothetical protein